MAIRKLVTFLILLCSFIATVVLAQEFSSTNFVDSNPVVSMGGAKSTSTNFQLFSGSGQVIIGENSSSAFISRAGFFYFPSVTTPIISATAGNAQAALGWTSAVGSLGFTISGYSVGRSTVSGGPYTFTNVGAVLANTASGLTNGTTYYFVVRALDFFGDPVVTSSQVSAVPTAPSDTGGGAGGAGGGGVGGVPSTPQTTVTFSGRAYPKSTITLLKDAQVAATTVAGADANFQVTLSGLSGGNYIFSLYSEDSQSNRSSLLSFPVGVTAGATTNVSGVFIAPTINVDKSQVKKGDNIAIFGQSSPNADVTIVVNSENEIFAKTKSDTGGAYLYNFDTTVLELGEHSTKSKAAINNEISSFGKAVGFSVGDKNITKTETKFLKGDLNKDGKVNLIDFSIAAYWYKRSISEVFRPVEVERLNGDGKVDLVDMSIIAYYWTG